MADPAITSKSGSTLAIALAIFSLLGTVANGYFTWSSNQEIEQIKANSSKELEILRQNFAKYRDEREAEQKNADSKQAEKALRCNTIKELHSSMTQDLTGLYASNDINVEIGKVNKLRADAAKAQTLFGPIGDAVYAQGTKRKLKPGEVKVVSDLSVAAAALMMEIRACNVG